MAIFGASPVSIVKLWDSKQFDLLATTDLLTHFGLLLSLRNFENRVNNSRTQYLLHKLFIEFVLRSKVSCFSVTILFGLRIEGRVDDQTVDEQRQILFDLVRLDGEFLLVFGSHLLDHFSNNLVANVVHVGASFRCTNRVYKRNLLESSVTQTADHLPTIAWRLSYFRALLCLLRLQVQVYILREILDFESFAIQSNPDFLGGTASHVVCPLREKSNNIIIKLFHAK